MEQFNEQVSKVFDGPVHSVGCGLTESCLSGLHANKVHIEFYFLSNHIEKQAWGRGMSREGKGT
jgi:hypothetical protein